VEEKECLSPTAIWNRLEAIDKKQFKFSLINASWATSGHIIFLRFSIDDNADHIRAQAKNIMETLSHRRDVSKFQFNPTCRISKLMLKGVPFHDPDNGDLSIPEEALVSEVARHPILSRVAFLSKPHWIPTDNNTESNLSTAFMSFQDPEGGYIKDILSREHFLFGQRVYAYEVHEKVELVQCGRCWEFGRHHNNCIPKCVICGNLSHLTNSHVEACAKCAQDGQTDLNGCTHAKCLNCGEAHYADDLSCKARAQAVYMERRRRAEIREKNSGVPPPARY
jgi:hypothetical protein